jgi:beta-glucosidase-like glycosyl hydrolase
MILFISLGFLLFGSYAIVPEDLLKQMTVDEKVAQMVQGFVAVTEPAELLTYPLGAMLTDTNGAPDPRPAGFLDFVNSFVNASLNTRLKIPILFGTHAVHGHNNCFGCTIFPHNVGYGATATGNETLGVHNVEEEGLITRDEMIATGATWTYAPVLGDAQV